MSVTAEKPTAATAIRLFHVDIPEEELADLRRRLAATRWPVPETVPDQSQGAQLSRLQGLVHYWGTDYDWRRAEAKLNALPQFITEIDGLDIHFIHVRSRHQDALPLIMTHGWPGSVLELLKVIEPLTDPTAHGGAAQDAFHLVIPAARLRLFGTSAGPRLGPRPDRPRLGRADEAPGTAPATSHRAETGGRSSPRRWAWRHRPALTGIHVNLAAAVPPEVEAALARAGPVPAMSEQERAVFDALSAYRKSGNSGYFAALTTRPQAVGYGLTDSPAGLAGLLLVASGVRAVDVRRGPGGAEDERRGAGRHHAVLADEHRSLVGPACTGKSRRKPHERDRDEDRPDLGPGGRHGLPGRCLPPPADVGLGRLSQPRLLPRGR